MKESRTLLRSGAPFALAVPLLVVTCGGGLDATQEYPSDAACGRLVADTKTERAQVMGCEFASECGQVFHESCGCTMDPVARLDADLTRYQALSARASELRCPGLGWGSTCSCPSTDGFACIDHVCTWNYVR